MKGIILAGGRGTRLFPSSFQVPKFLLSVYDKPMIYYPLATLMQAGIRDVLIISQKSEQMRVKKLLGSGKNLGIKISYAVEKIPKGTAPAITIAKKFIGNDSFCLIYCDNFFYSDELEKQMEESFCLTSGCHLYVKSVSDPERFGIVSKDSDGCIRIEEKPKNPKSNLAVTGLFFYDNRAVKFAEKVEPSSRGEFEITSVNNEYVKLSECSIKTLNDVSFWLDMGTHESIHRASNFVKEKEEQGIWIGCIEEVALKKQYITKEKLKELISNYSPSSYTQHLYDLIKR